MTELRSKREQSETVSFMTVNGIADLVGSRRQSMGIHSHLTLAVTVDWTKVDLEEDLDACPMQVTLGGEDEPLTSAFGKQIPFELVCRKYTHTRADFMVTGSVKVVIMLGAALDLNRRRRTICKTTSSVELLYDMTRVFARQAIPYRSKSASIIYFFASIPLSLIHIHAPLLNRRFHTPLS